MKKYVSINQSIFEATPLDGINPEIVDDDFRYLIYRKDLGKEIAEQAARIKEGTITVYALKNKGIRYTFSSIGEDTNHQILFQAKLDNYNWTNKERGRAAATEDLKNAYLRIRAIRASRARQYKELDKYIPF